MNNSSNAAADPGLPLGVVAKPQIALSDAERNIVLEILRRCVPDRQVWAYGSRATGTRLKKYSDLDLAVEGPALPGLARSELVEAFDESPLPRLGILLFLRAC